MGFSPRSVRQPTYPSSPIAGWSIELQAIVGAPDMLATDRNVSIKNGLKPAAEAPELQGMVDLMSAPMTFRRNVEIYGEGEPAEYLYRIQLGAVRTYKVLADGRRQV